MKRMIRLLFDVGSVAAHGTRRAKRDARARVDDCSGDRIRSTGIAAADENRRTGV
jgi:hypothetical protein